MIYKILKLNMRAFAYRNREDVHISMDKHMFPVVKCNHSEIGIGRKLCYNDSAYFIEAEPQTALLQS